VVQLLNAGASVEARTRAQGRTPLHLAAAAGHADLIPLLITPTTLEAEDSEHYTPLHLAAKYAMAGAAAVLVAAGASLGGPGIAFTPLWFAFRGMAQQQQVPPELALLFIDAALADPGSSQMVEEAVGWTASDNKTALHLAAAAGSTELVAKLVQAGADRDKVYQTGATPLWLAAAAGHAALVPLLFTPANINLAGPEGVKPLIAAVQRGDDAVVAALLTAKADPNVCGSHGNSALVLALQQGHTTVVTTLLAAGAKADSSNSSGSSVLSVALQCGHTQMLSLVLGALAKQCVQQKHHRLVELVAAEVAPLTVPRNKLLSCAQLLEVVLDVLGPAVAGEVCTAVQQQLQQALEDPPAGGASWISDSQRSYFVQISYLAEALLLGWLGAAERLHVARQPLVARLQRLVVQRGSGVTDVGQREQQPVQQGRDLKHQLQKLVEGAAQAAAAGQQRFALHLLGELAALHLQHSSSWDDAIRGADSIAEVIWGGMLLAGLRGRGARPYLMEGHEDYMMDIQKTSSFRPPGVYTTFLAAWAGARRQLQQLPREVAGVTVTGVKAAQQQQAVDEAEEEQLLSDLLAILQQAEAEAAAEQGAVEAAAAASEAEQQQLEGTLQLPLRQLVHQDVGTQTEPLAHHRHQQQRQRLPVPQQQPLRVQPLRPVLTTTVRSIQQQQRVQPLRPAPTTSVRSTQQQQTQRRWSVVMAPAGAMSCDGIATTAQPWLVPITARMWVLDVPAVD
jgi:ankyrin repeat protein